MAEITLRDEITFYCSRCENVIYADQKNTGKKPGIYINRCDSCVEEDANTRDELINRILELEEELKELKEA